MKKSAIKPLCVGFVRTFQPVRQPARAAVLAAAAAGLLGMAAGGCVADVPPSASNQGVVALFNPSNTPPQVPAPTDLVRTPNGLQIPVDPDEAKNPALKAFNDYLRSLDGFPPDSVASTTFSGPLDMASLSDAASVVVYDGTAKQLFTSPSVTPVLDASSGGKQLALNMQQRWLGGHTYVVALFSWQDSQGLHGLRGADGKPLLADTAFAFLRSTTPLVGKCADLSNSACACLNPSDGSCHAIVDGLSDDQAQKLEVARLQLQPLLDELLANPSVQRQRQQLVLAWNFTISTRSFATFDSDRGEVPFPSNLLLAGMGTSNQHVQLPILPTDDATTKALKAGLNTLDGFSTTASVRFPIATMLDAQPPVAIDPKMVQPGKSALLINILGGSPPVYRAQPLQALDANKMLGFAGQIWITPSRPLVGDGALYAAVLTNDVKDTQKQPLTPSVVTVLLTQPGPLVVQGRSAVPTLSLAQAQQLEAVRAMVSPLLGLFTAAGLDPAKIAAFTVFSTQSTVKPLLQLAGLPGLLQVPTTVTIDPGSPVTMLPMPLSNLSAIVHGRLTIRRAVDLLGPINLMRLGPDPANNETIPFVMTLPTKALAPSGAKVVIAQHGLTSWRGDMLAIANTLAGKGLAMLAIDIIYHGSRTACLSAADCSMGVTCNQPAANQPGTCMGQPRPEMGAQKMPGSNDVKPDSALPNRDFTNLQNPFAQRDNFRQHVIDLAQLVRVLRDGSPGGLSKKLTGNPMLPTLDVQNIGYLGTSLGAIIGTSFLSVSPDINLGVLNVGGAPLVDLFIDPTSVLSQGLAQKFGVTPGTLPFFDKVEALRWILDPADAINFASYVRQPDVMLMPMFVAKKVILQEAGKDAVIPNAWTLALGQQLGLPVDAMQHLQGIDKEGSGSATPVSTFFPLADHGSLLSPAADAMSTAKEQSQAATYLSTGLQGQPPTVQ